MLTPPPGTDTRQEALGLLTPVRTGNPSMANPICGHPQQTPPQTATHLSPCPICLSPFVAPGDISTPGPSERTVFRTSCGHRFHLPCIGEWVSARPTADCPSCRAALHVQACTELRAFCPVGGLNRGALDATPSTSVAQGQRHQSIVNRTSNAREAVRLAMLSRSQRQQPLAA